MTYQPKQCERCTSTFQPRSGFARFCSVECRRGKAACGHCGNVFARSDDKRSNKNQFCSTNCRWEWVKSDWSCPKCGLGDRPYETASYCRDCGNELARQYQADNDRSEYMNEWYQNNKDRFADYGNRRRARIADNGYEKYERRDIFNRDGGLCHICSGVVDLSVPYPHPQSFTVDHVIPISKGGPDIPANVATSHWICNKQKFTSIVEV